MDIIEDLGYALESYLSENPDSSEIGRMYLLIFGALQTLYFQQDAIMMWLGNRIYRGVCTYFYISL